MRGDKNQGSMKRKLKNPFAESLSPQLGGSNNHAANEDHKLELILDISNDANVYREGFLNFKVATIEKGKRTAAQKTWKFIWVVIKEQNMYLCKNWSRTKLVRIRN